MLQIQAESRKLKSHSDFVNKDTLIQKGLVWK